MRQHHVPRVRTHFGHSNFPYFRFLQSFSGAGVNGSSAGPFATTLPYAHEIKHNVKNCSHLRWLNTVLAVCEYMSFAKSWQEKDCSSQAETWQVKNILMKDFDGQVTV